MMGTETDASGRWVGSLAPARTHPAFCAVRLGPSRMGWTMAASDHSTAPAADASAPNKPNPWTRRSEAASRSRQTNPISTAPPWRCPGAPNKPNPAPRGPYPPARRAPRENALRRHYEQANKANPGRGDLGIDCGLGIIDELGSETPRAGVRQTKPISGWRRETEGRNGSSYGLQPPVFGLENAKQSQSGGPGARGGRAKESQLPQRHAESAVGPEPEPMAPNKANFTTGSPSSLSGQQAL